MNIKETIININEEVFQGDMLDIASGNNGIIYNFYKQYNNEVAVDYVNSKNKDHCNIDQMYDTCVLFFSINTISYNTEKSSLFNDINKYLKKGGRIYIWDIDKGLGKFYNGKIKVVSPNNQDDSVNIRNFNLIRDSSLKTTLKLLRKYFCICDLKTFDGLYYIKAVKRGYIIN